MLSRMLQEIARSFRPAALASRPIAWRKPINTAGRGRPCAAVVMATVGRESLLRAARSVFAQDIDSPIQLLIGVDVDKFGLTKTLRKVLHRECPPHVDLVWWEPGYSTSQRHGGVHRCFFGGSLRTALTFLANAPVVAYLDDDDWYRKDHLRLVCEAIKDKDWAFSLSCYADGVTGQALAVDEIESVGVDAGIYREKFGGFVRPSALALDKTKLGHVLHLWSEAMGPAGDAEDRLVFAELKSRPHACTGEPTVFYSLDPNDQQHEIRLRFLSGKGISHRLAMRNDSSR